MANSLVDFVLSVVRDPGTAAAYAADPAGTIAGAGLGDVTAADVDHLIPVVAESLPSVAPSTDWSGGNWNAPGAGDQGLGSGVWTSGAATAAFDAFGDHLPTTVDAGHVIDTTLESVGDGGGAALVPDTVGTLDGADGYADGLDGLPVVGHDVLAGMQDVHPLDGIDDPAGDALPDHANDHPGLDGLDVF